MVVKRNTRGVVIGVDFGGTKIAAAAVSGGRIVRRIEVPTGAGEGRDHVIGQLRSAIRGAAQGKPIARVGIGVPGLFSGTRIKLLANVPFLNGVDMKKALAPAIGRATLVLENDARCFALAEARLGAGRGAAHVLGITLGTGVGGGIVVDGKVYAGARGSAGEIGHTIMDPSVGSFAIGDGGDWENAISGRAMVAFYKSKGGARDRVTEFWREESAAAGATRDEMSRRIAIFVANLISVIDPHVVVIGGGAASPDLVRRVNALLPRYGAPRIARYAGLGSDAGVLGAALMCDVK